VNLIPAGDLARTNLSQLREKNKHFCFLIFPGFGVQKHHSTLSPSITHIAIEEFLR